MAKQLRYLFFDTELSGCEQIVSVGYIITDADGQTIEQDYFIVKPYRKISKTTIAIHGITTQQAKEQGITLRRAMARFINAAKACSVLIGYAPQNDILALAIGCKHLKRDIYFERGESTVVDVARMAARYMLKRGEIVPGQTPSLEHIHQVLTDGAPYDAHNALDDAKATAECFFRLFKDGYFGFEAIVPQYKIMQLCKGKHKQTDKPQSENADTSAEPSETVTEIIATETISIESATATITEDDSSDTDTTANQSRNKKKRSKRPKRRRRSKAKGTKTRGEESPTPTD